MADLVSYELSDGIATVTLDDGKLNVLSPTMLAEIDAALDRAEADEAVVLFQGREGVLSAGFDLKVFRSGDATAAADMLTAGFRLSHRMLSFPHPTVIACTGHAIAMGSFFLLSADHRIGARGDFRIVANEVAIAFVMPRTATEILRQRLTPAAFNQALVLAEPYTPENAVTAGFLDAAVDPADLHATALAAATRFASIDRAAHAASKLRAREAALTAMAVAIAADDADLRG